MTKDTILFIGYFVPPKEVSEEIRSYFGSEIKIAILYDKTKSGKKTEACRQFIDAEYSVDFMTDEPEQLIERIGDTLLSVTTRGETFLEEYQRLLPLLENYVKVPSAKSVGVSMSKAGTRQALHSYCPEVSTNFLEFKATEMTESIVSRIKNELKFPIIIKPIGLSTSMLVTRANNLLELQDSIVGITNRLEKIYDLRHGRGEQKIIVEEFISGDLYSIDTYIDERGVPIFCPMVKTITGVAAGKTDYYGYFQITPSGLNKDQITAAEEVALKVISATGLRSSSAHIELMYDGMKWYAIEIGPRTGGYRTQMYKFAYGMNHNINDILIHFNPSKINVGNQIAFAAMIKKYEDVEGRIIRIDCLDEVKAIDEVKVVVQNLSVGQEFIFAKNGGVSIFEIIVAGKSEQRLLSVLDEIETLLKIEIE